MSRPASSAVLSPKGERTIATILRACVAIVGEEGAAAMSQEAVARRAGISQSALRHHFSTKDALLDAVFAGAYDRYRADFTDILLDVELDAGGKLRRLIESHFDHIADTRDAYIFEAFAHTAREPSARRRRDEWYRWLAGHYGDLIQQMSPSLAKAETQACAYQVLTLVLGAWITFGRSRPDLLDGDPARMKASLWTAIDRLLPTPVSGEVHA